MSLDKLAERERAGDVVRVGVAPDNGEKRKAAREAPDRLDFVEHGGFAQQHAEFVPVDESLAEENEAGVVVKGGAIPVSLTMTRSPDEMGLSGGVKRKVSWFFSITLMFFRGSTRASRISCRRLPVPMR